MVASFEGIAADVLRKRRRPSLSGRFACVWFVALEPRGSEIERSGRALHTRGAPTHPVACLETYHCNPTWSAPVLQSIRRSPRRRPRRHRAPLAASRVLVVSRTIRNCGRPDRRRFRASAMPSRGITSTIGRTPVSSAKRMVSSMSTALPVR